MRNIALMPEGDVFEGGDGVAAEDARETGETFPGYGISFMGHRAGTFLAFGKGFLGFEHFGALQVAEFHRPALNARADECQSDLKFGVDVALDNLRGNGRGAQAEFIADEIFNLG